MKALPKKAGRPPDDSTAPLILAYIKAYKVQHDGNSPSIREIARGVNRALQTVQDGLWELEYAGLIRRSVACSRARCIQVVGGRYLPPESRAS